MDSKKKMIIAVSSFAMVVLAAIVAVVAVLAAQSVTIKSTININYSVEDVFGSAKVSYKLEGDTQFTNWGSVLTFDENTETGAESSLTDPGFNLTREKSYVIIKFELKKKDDTVENFSATLQYASTKAKNMTVTSGTAEDAITTEATANMFNAVTISSSEYTAFYVKIAISSVDADAEFAGTFNWALRNIAA